MRSTRNDGMTTTLDELPADVETCHQLIRELLKSPTSRLTSARSSSTSSNSSCVSVMAARPRRSTPLNFCSSPVRSWCPRKPRPPNRRRQLTRRQPTDTPPTPDSSSPPKKKGHGRKPLPASLPRKQEIHDVPAEYLPCPDCGTQRIRIGEEIREQLEQCAGQLDRHPARAAQVRV